MKSEKTIKTTRIPLVFNLTDPICATTLSPTYQHLPTLHPHKPHRPT